jgi:lysophospholipase L1-like esterase
VLLLPSGIFLLFKKVETFSITCILLLFTNLFTSNILMFHDFKTMPKNYNITLIVRGNVMPNFEGLNTISTDDKGFRSLNKVDYENENTFRIFAIGGSTTEETFVDDKETWTSLLEIGLTNSYNKSSEVINTGVSGLRAVHHLATMKETEKYHPDVYIFLMGVNDWNKHIKDNFLGLSANSLINLPNSLIWKGLSFVKSIVSSKNSKVSEVSEVIEEYGNYYSKQNNSLEKDDVRIFLPENIDSEYELMVKKIASKCNENKYICFFLNQPSAYSTQLTEDLKKRLWMTPPNVEYTLDLGSLIHTSNLYNTELKRLANNNDIYFCDIASQIKPTTDYFYDDVHFNEKGSVKVANAVLECLIPILRK